MPDRYNYLLLREDRESRRISREALVRMGGGTFSLSSLERLERGKGTIAILRQVAHALGKSVESYRSRPLQDAYGLDLSGVWTVFFLEQDAGTDPYLHTERLTILQDRATVTGQYEGIKTEHPDGGYKGDEVTYDMTGHIKRDVVFGTYSVRGRALPRGSGSFQLKFTREGWGEGFCTFASDDGQIGCSPNIWVKSDAPELRYMVKQARDAILNFGTFGVAPFSIRPR
jgi:transcriptional regulator with XRE-family HTH domain